MKIKDKKDDRGLGMPWAKNLHQEKQDDMVETFQRLFPSLEKHVKRCYTVKKDDEPEDEKTEGKVPDIVIYAKVEKGSDGYHQSDPVMFIEVDNETSIYKTKKKPRFLFENIQKAEEVFIYRYDKGSFSKYVKGNYVNSERTSYSEVLGFDIRKLLEYDKEYFKIINIIQRRIDFNWTKIIILNNGDISLKFFTLIEIQGDEYTPYFKPRLTLFKESDSFTRPLLTIEVVDDDTEWLTGQTVKRYQLANPTIEESWLYNMDSKDWKKVANGRMVRANRSKVLGIDVRELMD